MKTYSAKLADLKPQWHLIDASGKTLGRLATEVAALLIGKHKTTYAPNLNCGDYVVVINASQVKLTGKKAQNKMYYSHSNYPGGLKRQKFERVMEKHPDRIIGAAVRGMIPRNHLGDSMMRRLKVYEGNNHPHGIQIALSSADDGKSKSKGKRKGEV